MVAVVSVKGSPGVTTLCLALAARWPGPARAVVMEADPAGGDVAMRFGLPLLPGLLSLAAAARGDTGGWDPGLLWRHAQALPGGLSVVAAPPDAGRVRGTLAALVPPGGVGGSHTGPLRAAADHPGAVVIVDGGRVDPDSPALPLLGAAEVLVVLIRSGADDLAHLVRRIPEIGAWSRRPVLLLSGPGHSISAVARELGVTPLGRVPHDPRGAAVLAGRRSVLRWHRSGPGRSLLGRAAHDIATMLAREVTPAPPSVGPPPVGAPWSVGVDEPTTRGPAPGALRLGIRRRLRREREAS
jgi:hypothetical protein